MALLGIDFGTTNTVVVCCDRGRYPIVRHATETAIGPVVREVFPSLLAYDHNTGLLLYGADAERCLTRGGQGRRYGVIRSLKRALRDYVGGGRIGVDVIPGGFDTVEVLQGFAAALRKSVMRSGLFVDGEPLQAVITWPAHANGAQRHVTRQCFRTAGFEVIGTLNEPTAAAMEFADRVVGGNRTAARKLTGAVAIFDFGGGTFDASIVKIDETAFTVVDTAGIADLGGDDLDNILARLFAAKMKVDFDTLPLWQRDWLLRHACLQKESIASGSALSLTLVPSDVGLKGEVCAVGVAETLQRLRVAILPAVDVLWTLANGPTTRAAGIDPQRLDAIYLVGGASKLPVVAQAVAARFPGVRLVMSDKPFTATAMGAAIHSAERLTLHDILSRHFGVLRLADHGSREYFAPIFHAGTRLPRRHAPAVERQVEYLPRHNIGHLRYLECAGVDAQGRPTMGVRPWSDVFFPYDPKIPIGQRVTCDDIHERGDLGDHPICETYSCDSDGIISVRLTRQKDGQSRSYEIFRD